jgi:hypothetical protein
MIRIGDTLRIRGSRDRTGQTIPAATWTVVALDRIEGSAMYSAVARGLAASGRTLWMSGRVDAVGRPGHPPSPMHGDDSIGWETEHYARENHAERVAGEAM